jgi:hypothetical protein
MRYASWGFLFLALLLLGVRGLSVPTGERGWFALSAVEAADREAGKPAEKPKGPPPLKVDRSAPLLLDNPAEKKPAKEGKGPKADNSACYVCHTNYQDEELVGEHAIANVGCVKCHGQSTAHRNDENNITPPDTMYPNAAIEPACVKCHETHDVPARKVLARFTERCPNKKTSDQVVCTDCHGDHRLKLRSVRWDKKTGKLITTGEPKPQTVPEGQKK